MQTNELISNPQPTNTPTSQQQPSNVSPPVQESTQGNKTNKWLIIGLGIFALVTLVIAGIFAYQNYQLKKQVEKSSPGSEVIPTKLLQPTPTNTISAPSPTTPADPTASWKTYTNTETGFTFKYPETWTEKGPVAEHDTTIVYIHADEKFGEGPEPIQYYLWVEKTKELPEREYTRESVGGYAAYKTDQEPSRSGALTYFITKDETQYIIISLTPYDTGELWPAQDQYIKTFNQILSTFKFTK